MTNSFLEDQARARGMTVSEMPRRNPPVLRQCLYCGKDFYAHVCEIKKNKSKTCSRKCSACGDDSSNTVYHWANKSGEYKKSLLDWRRLCAGCHKREKKVLV